MPTRLDGRRAVVVGPTGPIGSTHRAIAGALADAGAVPGRLDGSSIDVVVHLADPRCHEAALLEIDETAWDLAAEEPARAFLATLQAAHPGLRAAGGRLVAVVPSSGLQGAPGLVAATTGWEVVRLLAKSAARRWAADGITVNVVASRVRVSGDQAVANAVLLLAADEAVHLTGATVQVDGGAVDAAVTSVLLTGASGGIGRGLAAAFAAAGWDVAVTACRLDDADRVATEAGGGAVGMVCDVTVGAQVDSAIEPAVERFGGVDAVVHCAVSGRSSEPVDLEHAPLTLWDEHAAVSLRATWHLARAAFDPLRASQGSLLLLTSPAGINGSANLSFYAAVKGGQLAFVRSLAREWAADRIRVNGLSPLALTPAMEAAFANDPNLGARITGLIPMGRLGDPEHDIGPPAVFLCSGAAGYITGQNLVVSGGRLMSA